MSYSQRVISMDGTNAMDMQSLHSEDTRADPGCSNLNARRIRAFMEIDNAQYSRFHWKVALIAGIGFFTDAYNLFAIGIASVMLGYVYGGEVLITPNSSSCHHNSIKDTNHELAKNLDLSLKIAAPLGTFFGPVFFGWLADMMGRKRMYGIELMIIVIGSFGQAVSSGGQGINIFAVLIVWRVIMGFGIGGDYPSSAVIASEFAPRAFRGRLMTAVFASQGFGQLCATVVAIVVTAAYKDSLRQNNNTNFEPLTVMWRILIGLGCVPGTIALFFRLTIPETPRFTMDIERNIDQAIQDIDKFLKTGTFKIDPDARIERVNAPRASFRDFKAYFSDRENFRVLFGCSYCWFVLDVAFYGLGLNSPVLLGDLFSVEGKPAYDQLINIAKGNIILVCAGLLPGFALCFLFIDRWGRKRLQYIGFAGSTVLFIIMGKPFSRSLKPFSSDRSQVLGEAFPTRYRSTAHGIAASAGKLGAILAQLAFTKLKDRGGKNKAISHILEVYALFTLTGCAATWLIQETKDLSLEELSNEDQDNFIKGRHSDHSLRYTYESNGHAL
ncbi:hypothetical protein NLI96_g1139 [Meripilus lineatus]|uniref:Major facilitator superfamily (MFS) profile domain-containing protein n=1 Tax=Meripilus lineatus TaxID=2056292 RepID=A0AAD5VB74_9APHY|nr:hypothetical protein NLI96_g1139 [Physisporinus lineatus]